MCVIQKPNLILVLWKNILFLSRLVQNKFGAYLATDWCNSCGGALWSFCERSSCDELETPTAANHCFCYWLIIQLFLRLIVESIRCKNAHHDFPVPKVASSNDFFWPTITPKPKDSLFTVRNVKENSKSSLLRSLNWEIFDVFARKTTETINQLIEIVDNHFSFDQWIDSSTDITEK